MSWTATRRSFIRTGAIGLGTAYAASAIPGMAWGAAPDDFPIATTVSGKLQGMNFGGIMRFLGVPYGASTAGANRFRPARPVKPWTGIREAFGFGQIAPQRPADLRGEYTRLIEWDKQNGGMGEDCLVLNVWTPALNDGKKRPVFVSFHGGGFSAGSAGAPGFNGDPLARYGDAVVVTVNHRLAAFGFLHLADLIGPEFAQSGNLGMLDLEAALKWVRANVEAFGGDPSRVTIFGQSGGGRKVSSMLSLPSSKGLFHRGIVESGSISRFLSPDEATANARTLLEELGIAPANARKILDVPMIDLLNAQTRAGAKVGPLGFMPMVDGRVYPAYPALQNSADVPVIIGTTRDESALYMTDYDLDQAGLDAWADKRFGANGKRVVGAYRKAYPDISPYMTKVRIDTQWDRRARAIKQADQRAALKGAPTWLFRFDAPSPADGGKFGAVHGIEVALAFHNPLETITAEAPPYIRKLNDQVADIWLTFGKTGDPNNPSIPKWQPYDSASRTSLLLDKEVRAVGDPDHDLRLLRDEIGDAGAPRD
jgi:para-nitrobenzyl esterase